MDRKQLLDRMLEAEKEMRAAIRWLAEIERFKNVHAAEDWQDAETALSQVAIIAKEVYGEAMISVIKMRRAYIVAREQLVSFDRKQVVR